MRKRAIQSNLSFVAPVDDITNLEFASRQTPTTQQHDGMHSDLNKQLSDEVMFNDASASIDATPVLPLVRFQSKPSSSRINFGFGLSSSSYEPLNEEVKIDDQVQVNPNAELESTHKLQDDAATTNHGPSKPPVNLEPNKAKPQDYTSNTGSSAGNYIDPFSLLGNPKQCFRHYENG